MQVVISKKFLMFAHSGYFQLNSRSPKGTVILLHPAVAFISDYLCQVFTQMFTIIHEMSSNTHLCWFCIRIRIRSNRDSIIIVVFFFTTLVKSHVNTNNVFFLNTLSAKHPYPASVTVLFEIEIQSSQIFAGGQNSRSNSLY